MIQARYWRGKRNAYRILMGETEGRKLLRDLGRDGRVVLNIILEKHFGCECCLG
jgi:hypothetical protein